MEIKSAGTWIISKIFIWHKLQRDVTQGVVTSIHESVFKTDYSLVTIGWRCSFICFEKLLVSKGEGFSWGSKTDPQKSPVFVWLNGGSPVFFFLILDLVKCSGRCDWERWELCNCVFPTCKSYNHVQIRSTATCSKVCRTVAAKCTPALTASQNYRADLPHFGF